MPTLMRRMPAAIAVCLLTLTGAGPALAADTTTTTPTKAVPSSTVPVSTPASVTPPSLVTAPTIAPVSATTAAPVTIKQRSARRTVDTLIVVLLVLAVLVLGVTFWYWRVTKPVPRQLEPLATMSTRTWRKAPAARREARLEKVHALAAPLPPPQQDDRPVDQPLDPLLEPAPPAAHSEAADS
ncbi:MAG: hypothetical protein ABJD24_05720 [Acidimicrobiales bacterium]